MRLTKKQWAFLIIAVLVLALQLFLFMNISMFYSQMQAFEAAKTACISLNEGDACSFTIDEAEFTGRCVKDRKKTLACKPVLLFSNKGSLFNSNTSKMQQ